jgi:HK97 family phage major capsid protein
MTTEAKHVESVEALVDLKTVEAAIVEKMGEFKSANEQMAGEIAESGKVSTETKGRIDDVIEKYDALYDRVQGIEQKGIKAAEAAEGFDLGAEFIKSEQYQQLQSGKGKSARVDLELKTAVINATGQNQPLVAADRAMGINTTPNRILTIRDLLPTSQTSSNLIEFVRESSFTNNAAAQGTGSSPEVFENVAKAESAVAYTLVTEAVPTIAHFIPASRQVLSDSAELQSQINGRLMYGLKLVEETQMLTGTGGGHELNGLVTQATAWANESPNITNQLDIIRSAVKQAHIAEYRPNFIVLNPQEWFDIEIKKVGSSDDRYVIGNPGSLMGPTLWGLPVIVTNSMTAGSFLIGSSMGAEIKDRAQATVEVSREHSTNFTTNMVTILAEERLALCVKRVEAFITGSL